MLPEDAARALGVTVRSMKILEKFWASRCAPEVFGGVLGITVRCRSWKSFGRHGALHEDPGGDFVVTEDRGEVLGVTVRSVKILKEVLRHSALPEGPP